MNYLFIINPVAGNGKKSVAVANYVRNTLDNLPDITWSIEFTRSPGHARELSTKAAQDNTDVVVAVGGDGTMNEVAGGLLHSRTALGVIPVGSGNGFAGSLNLPKQVSESLKLLLNPRIEHMDAGQINDRYFFGVAGVGYDAMMAQKFQLLPKRGPVPYIITGIKEFFRYKYQYFTLTYQGKEHRISPLLIAFANTSQYGNGAVIAPRADFRDGWLELCTLQPLSAADALMNVPYLFRGKIDQLKAYSRIKVKELSIRSNKNPIVFHTDGEPGENGRSLKVNILQSALKICLANV